MRKKREQNKGYEVWKRKKTKLFLLYLITNTAYKKTKEKLYVRVQADLLRQLDTKISIKTAFLNYTLNRQCESNCLKRKILFTIATKM